jgi:hypothetical protein
MAQKPSMTSPIMLKTTFVFLIGRSLLVRGIFALMQRRRRLTVQGLPPVLLTNLLGDVSRMTSCHIASSRSFAKMFGVLGELYKGREITITIVLPGISVFSVRPSGTRSLEIDLHRSVERKLKRPVMFLPH